MRIGELSRHSGCDVETIRYYEREGLLDAPQREDNGYRRYGDGHLVQLNFVRHCRSLGMSLADVRRLRDFQRNLGGIRAAGGDVYGIVAQSQLAADQAKKAASQAVADARRMVCPFVEALLPRSTVALDIVSTAPLVMKAAPPSPTGSQRWESCPHPFGCVACPAS